MVRFTYRASQITKVSGVNFTALQVRKSSNSIAASRGDPELEKQKEFPYRESNPGLLGESQLS